MPRDKSDVRTDIKRENAARKRLLDRIVLAKQNLALCNGRLASLKQELANAPEPPKYFY
jgi:hypothetical protein